MLFAINVINIFCLF